MLISHPAQNPMAITPRPTTYRLMYDDWFDEVIAPDLASAAAQLDPSALPHTAYCWVGDHWYNCFSELAILQKSAALIAALN